MSRLRRLLLIACIFLDFIFLLFLLADSFVYPLYRTHLNLAMIQMTLLGGGRIVAFSSVMLSEIALMVLAVLIVSYFFTRFSFVLTRYKKSIFTLFAFVLMPELPADLTLNGYAA